MLGVEQPRASELAALPALTWPRPRPVEESAWTDDTWAKAQGGAACLSNNERSPERGRRGAAAARFAVGQAIARRAGPRSSREDALKVRVRAEEPVSLVAELGQGGEPTARAA
jgi:hypothetical protein